MYATGDVEIRTIMEELRRQPLMKREETGDKMLNIITGAAQAGAGGSVFQHCRSCGRKYIDSALRFRLMILESGTGKIDMEANAVQYVQTIAAARPVHP